MFSKPSVVSMTFAALSVAAATVLSACGPERASPSLQNSSRNVIYGGDDRTEFFEISDPTLKGYARAVGIILTLQQPFIIEGSADKLSIGSGTLSEILNASYGKEACLDVRFRDQIRPGSCSGFLISPSVFVTAGHCIEDGIANLLAVISFVVPGPELATSKSLEVSRSQVYSFKRILATRNEHPRMDFAFLELDRPVEGADPFAIEIEPESRLGDPLLLLGHPAGLPLKYTAGGRLASDDGVKFSANYDAFGGNSGSLVMNLRTGKVIGIHTTATVEDWSYDSDRNCMRETRARDSRRPGGGMVKLSEVYKVLSSSERAKLTDRRGTETPIPVSSGGRICVLKADANGFDYFNSDPVFDRSDLIYVSAGAQLEILGEEPVYFQGSSQEGVRMKVLTSHGPSYAAKPGTLLWTYKALLNCR